jgi:hypothetical protein
MPSDSVSPGFIHDAAFRAGAVEGLLALPQASDDRLQFFEALRMSVLASLQEVDPDSSLSPTIFVRSLRPRETAAEFGTPTRVFDIEFRDPKQWQGQLVFTAQHGSGGWSVPLPGGDLTQAVKRLIDKGLGELPIATVYPRKRIISCAADGAAADGLTLKLGLPIDTRSISLQDIEEVLEIIRKDGLITPAVCPPNLWNDPEHYVPSEQVERLLQWCVASEMRAHFRPILAEREQIATVGRIDICLTDPSSVEQEKRHPAVVELKVLRSKTSNGEAVNERSNLAAVVSGMRQAKAYRVIKKAALGVLACFDLRREKNDVLSNATPLKAHGRYFDDRMAVTVLRIYGVPEHAQEEVAANR